MILGVFSKLNHSMILWSLENVIGTSPFSKLDEINEAVLISYAPYSPALCECCLFYMHWVAEYSPASRAIFEAQCGDLATQMQFKPVRVAARSIQTLPIALKKAI